MGDTDMVVLTVNLICLSVLILLHAEESQCAILSPCQPVAKLASLFGRDR